MGHSTQIHQVMIAAPLLKFRDNIYIGYLYVFIVIKTGYYFLL